MSFMTFSLLMGGAALAGIPVVLHFLMRGKPQRHEFPALRFVQSRRMLNQRRFRLRHLLLLALRVLLIVILGLALARPVMKFSGSIGSREAPIAAALVFDTAPRMDYTQANRTRLDEAKEFGEWIVPRFPKESQVAIVDGRRTPATFQVDMRAAEQRIERLGTTSSGRSVSQSVAAALELLERSSLERRELYVMTDMSDAAWSTDVASTIQQLAERMPDLGVYVIDVGAKEPSNTGIERLSLSKQTVAGRAPIILDVELAHWGTPKTREVQLFVDGRAAARGAVEEKRGQRTVTFDKDNPRRVVPFPIPPLTPGMHQGEVRLIGEDGLAADDVRYFTFEVREAWPVLIAAPEPVDDYALYMREAIAPAIARERGEAEYACDVVSHKELQTYIDANRLEGYAAVLMLDPAPINAERWNRLRDWVERGRGLGVFLGRRARADEASFNTPAAQRLLAGRLKRETRAPDGDVFIWPETYDMPIVADFRRAGENVPWAASPVFRYWQLGDLIEGSRAVPYNDGRPAIIIRGVGKGRVLTMTTPVSDSLNDRPWNELPTGPAKWPFVLLARGMAQYLAGAGRQQYNYLAGQTAVLHLPPDRLMNSYVLAKPDGRAMRIAPDTDAAAIRASTTEEVGNYAIRASGEGNGERRGFTVNIAPGQIDLTRLSDEQLASVWGDVDYRLARDREQIEVGVSRGRVGRELAPLLLLLLTMLFAAELAMSNRFYKD